MKRNSAKDRVQHEPDEALIRDYAEHLFEQSGRMPGQDLDNWLEAEACLTANLPRFGTDRTGDADDRLHAAGSTSHHSRRQR